MSDDLPERLRAIAETFGGCEWNHPITAAPECWRAASELERLRKFMSELARCPECDDLTCEPGCQFGIYCPERAALADQARAALRGDE
jgi:hypothetical protein